MLLGVEAGMTGRNVTERLDVGLFLPPSFRMIETLLFAGTDGSGSSPAPDSPLHGGGMRAPQPSREDTEVGKDRVKSAPWGRM